MIIVRFILQFDKFLKVIFWPILRVRFMHSKIGFGTRRENGWHQRHRQVSNSLRLLLKSLAPHWHPA